MDIASELNNFEKMLLSDLKEYLKVREVSVTGYLKPTLVDIAKCVESLKWDHLKCLLQQVTFVCALWDSDINCNWLSWKDVLFAAIDECVPKTNARKKSYAPWMSKELIVSVEKKRLLYKKARQTNKISVWSKYREKEQITWYP